MKNDIDEEYYDIQNGMKETFAQLLLRIIEDNNPKKSKDTINNLYQKCLTEFLPKDIAIEIIDILYIEESLLKTAILDRIDVEIIKESQRQRTQFDN